MIKNLITLFLCGLFVLLIGTHIISAGTYAAMETTQDVTIARVESKRVRSKHSYHWEYVGYYTLEYNGESYDLHTRYIQHKMNEGDIYSCGFNSNNPQQAILDIESKDSQYTLLALGILILLLIVIYLFRSKR